MSNLIIICGPQAVGKMTVAESLRDKLNYNLMVNHDSIEISDKIFGFATPAQCELNAAFREKVFELAIKHNIDLLFTYVCAFEMPEEREYLTGLAGLFQSAGGNFYFVELNADIETRIERNATPHRMEMKALKRDIEWSKADLLKTAEEHRLNTYDNEVWFANHIKIDNTNLEPGEVADIIIKKFSLVANKKEEYEYRELNRDEICHGLFNGFIRRQKVTKCWRKINGEWVIKDDPFIDDWTEKDYEVLVSCLKNTAATGGFVYAAFYNGVLKGFVSVEPGLSGGRQKYLDLSSIHVSEDMRGKGIGKKLFNAAKEWAKENGAAKLYISAHSAVESQAFYKAMGCVEAQVYNKEHVEKEPYDCQLECVL